MRIDIDENTRQSFDNIAVMRLRQRGHYDKATIRAILDDVLIVSVASIAHDEDGTAYPVCLPMLFARTVSGNDEDVIFLHGANANRTMRLDDEQLCLSATIVDSLVLAKSAFNSSANYRSACLFGRATPVRDDIERLRALELITNHVCADRWRHTRPPKPAELQVDRL